MISSSFSRLRHQLHTEWLHHHWSIVIWCGWLALRHWLRVSPVNVEMRSTFTSLDQTALACTAFLGAAMVFRCIRADAPLNPDSAVQTRPLGRPILWLAKGLFIFMALMLPWFIAETLRWRGFDHPLSQWLALSTGALLMAGVVAGLAAAVAAWATTPTQSAFFAAIAGGGLSLISEGDIWLPLRHAGGREAGAIIGTVLLLTGLVLFTWVCFVPRRRGLAMLILGIALIQYPLTEAAWSYNWLKRMPPRYPAAQLTLSIGAKDPNTAAAVQSLWPTLHLQGLEPDEVATVLEFAPVTRGGKWPPLGSYSDLGAGSSHQLNWLQVDHFRSLMKHEDSTVLWGDVINGGGIHSRRRGLDSVTAAWKLSQTASPPAVRLRLAIHQMKPVTSLPLRKLWSKAHRFIIHPGLRLEFSPFEFRYGSWRSEGSVYRQNAELISREPHAMIRARGQALMPSFILVLKDPELRENEAHDFYYQKNFSVSREKGSPWQMDERHAFSLMINEPEGQRLFLGKSMDDWIDRVTATLWHAEERGTVELDLSSEEVARLLATLKDDES